MPMPPISPVEEIFTHRRGAVEKLDDKNRSDMNQDHNPYRQLLLDLRADLSYLAKKHGERFLEQAVRDATKSEVLQEIANDLTRRRSELEESEAETTDEQDTGEESTGEEDVPPEELDYPDEDVWTVPPAPDEEESEDDGEEDGEHELSEAGKMVLSELMDRFTGRAQE
jgi:hypothetical protein